MTTAINPQSATMIPSLAMPFAEAASRPVPERQPADRQPPTKRAAVDMPAEAQHVRQARSFTAYLLTRWNVIGDDQDSAVLMVSELTTNAVRYGQSTMTVALDLVGRTLRIEVTDYGEPDSAPACASDVQADDEHGRGLGIVESLADSTDVRHAHGGRRVRVTMNVAAPCRDHFAREVIG
jgi:anti-sigma regulatory factor (Ser/Thr protein kinase)